MKILVAGSGGREHALCWRLSADPEVSAIVAAPGNPGIAEHAVLAAVDPGDPDALLALAERESIDLTVIGPELPLDRGVVDRFREKGLRIFGPPRAAAQLECSKVFAKGFMARHAIPTARYRVCESSAAARQSEAQRVRKLVDAAQEGDRNALEDLYLIHFDRIYSYLHVSVGNRHDAEDLTTQTFLKMLEKIGSFKWQSAPFSAWLFRIAHNLAMDHFRAHRRWQPEEEVPEPPGEEEPSAELKAMQTVGRESMLKLIDHLSPEQQQVLTLKFVFNLPNAEVAAILDKTEGAIKSLQHRALVSLQKQIQQQEA